MLNGFWIRNYKSLRQVGIGSSFPKFVFIDDETDVQSYDLTPVTLFTGPNGTGKSSVVDVFSFVSDCYRNGVEYACAKRGGFDAVYSQGSKGAISFGFHYQQQGEEDVATYAISIYRTKNKVPYIESEVLAYQRGEESLPIIFLQNGAEKTIRYLAPDERLTNEELTQIEFTDHNHLGLAALESHPKYPVLASLRSLFESWTLCNFTLDPTQGWDKLSFRRQDLSSRSTLPGLIQYYSEQYKNKLRSIFSRIAADIPNVERIILDDDNLENPMLSFLLYDRDEHVPLSHMSAATIRLMYYAMLLEEQPALLTFFEEPENGLDRDHRGKILEILHRFEKTLPANQPQVLINTHHPAVVNSFHPAQVWVFEKDREGFTAVERAFDSILFQSEEEINNPNWFSVLFDEKR